MVLIRIGVENTGFTITKPKLQIEFAPKLTAPSCEGQMVVHLSLYQMWLVVVRQPFVGKPQRILVTMLTLLIISITEAGLFGGR